MTKVKQLDWDKLTPGIKEHKPIIDTNVRLWKHKTSKPVKPFFTCSKCKTNCETRTGLKEHWLVEHDA